MYVIIEGTLQKLDQTIDDIRAGLTLALQVVQQKDTTTIQDDIQDTKLAVHLIRGSQITIQDGIKDTKATVSLMRDSQMKNEDDVEDTKAVLNRIRNTQVSHELRSWSGLKAPDVSVNYNEACKKRHSGTGHWFV